MKALQITRSGNTDVFEQTDIPIPDCGEDEVLVRIKARSINPVDVKLRQGMRRELDYPATLGYDFAGVVEKTGINTSFTKGDEVYSCGASPEQGKGSYAEYTVVHETTLALKPTNTTFEEAASLPLVCLTAWESLDKLSLTEKDTLLVHGGAGGVGSIVIQLAKHLGAEVYSTVSTQKKANFVKKLGATPILYKEEDFTKHKFTKIFDCICEENFTKSLTALEPYGEIVTILPTPELTEEQRTTLFVNNQSIHYVMMLLPVLQDDIPRMTEQGTILERCSELVEEGKLKPVVAKTFALENVAKAHDYFEQERFIGKIVLN